MELSCVSMWRKPTKVRTLFTERRFGDDVLVPYYYSVHNNNNKISENVIGFFLRAQRICSPELLKAKVAYVTNTFMKHEYPRGVLLKLRMKAEKILKSDPELFFFRITVMYHFLGCQLCQHTRWKDT